LKIGFDLDGCIVKLFPLLQRECIKLYKGKIKIGEKTTPEIKICLNNIFMQPDKIPAYTGAIEFIQNYYQKTRKPIIFITSRDKKYSRVTKYWIQKYLKNIPFHIYYSEHKWDIINKLSLDMYIEDRTYLVTNIFAHTNCILFVPRRKWNIDLQRSQSVSHICGFAKNDKIKFFKTWKALGEIYEKVTIKCERKNPKRISSMAK
jgi:hypothetical protein